MTNEYTIVAIDSKDKLPTDATIQRNTVFIDFSIDSKTSTGWIFTSGKGFEEEKITVVTSDLKYVPGSIAQLNGIFYIYCDGWQITIDQKVNIDDVGNFIDVIAGKVRTPGAVAGRLLEEVVELCLSTGMRPGKIFEHVADALHNQSLKESKEISRTIFPSELDLSNNLDSELAEECADVSLVLKDLCYVANVNLDEEEVRKWSKFVKKDFTVSKNGTVYACKAHIKSN